MQNELLSLIDSIFEEFQDKKPNSQPTAAATSVPEKLSEDEDSDWYDVPLDEPGQIADTAKPGSSLSGEGSLLNINSSISANLHFTCSQAEIQGIVTGNIVMPPASMLLISRTAIITGHIEGSTVKVCGVVLGNIHADQVEIMETGSIQGDVFYTNAIAVAQGAEVCGRIQKNKLL